MKGGRVYLVGAGPGDPKLITVRGLELMRAADVVVYDHLVAPRLLKECPVRAKIIYAGKEGGSDPKAKNLQLSRLGSDPGDIQRAINTLLIREANAGRTVVRLKGGDPFLFGRGGEEALALRKAKVADAPRGPLALDDYGNPIENVYIRKVERVNGELQNTVIHTFPSVSQFWRYSPADYLKQPLYSRRYVPPPSQ